MMKLLAFALACSLAGCATAPAPVTIEKPIEVKIPVAVPCVKGLPDQPVFLDDRALLTGSGAQVFDRVWADHLARRDYIDELRAVLIGCARPIPDNAAPTK